MDTLALKEGDFTLVGGSFGFFTGAPKVEQDLKLALGEPIGNDRFHPGWGSQLSQFIGFPLDMALAFQVQQECARVVNNYIAVQLDKIQTQTLNGQQSTFNTSDVIASVSGLNVNPTNNRIDILITIETADSATVTLSTSVSQ